MAYASSIIAAGLRWLMLVKRVHPWKHAKCRGCRPFLSTKNVMAWNSSKETALVRALQASQRGIA